MIFSFFACNRSLRKVGEEALVKIRMRVAQASISSGLLLCRSARPPGRVGALGLSFMCLNL